MPWNAHHRLHHLESRNPSFYILLARRVLLSSSKKVFFSSPTVNVLFFYYFSPLVKSSPCLICDSDNEISYCRRLAYWQHNAGSHGHRPTTDDVRDDKRPSADKWIYRLCLRVPLVSRHLLDDVFSPSLRGVHDSMST